MKCLALVKRLSLPTHISTAAVADYKAVSVADNKIKKTVMS